MKYSVTLQKTKDYIIAKQVPIAIFIFDDETKIITIENMDGKEILVKDILGDEELIIGQGGKEYKVTDGMKFMENLKYQFSGSHIRASNIKKHE